MSLMLLSQASLFSDKGLIGLDTSTKVTMSKNADVAISYNTTELNIYRKSGQSWVRPNSFAGLSDVREVKLSEDGVKVAVAYSTTNSFYPNRIQVYNLDLGSSTLSTSSLVSSGSTNIWYFDVNSLGVVYTIAGSLINLFRFSDSSTQSISFTEIGGGSAAWFNSNSSLNFKWTGQSSTGIHSVGTVSVLSNSTFTQVVTQTNLQPSEGGFSDFSRSNFSYVGSMGSSLSFFVTNSSFLQTFTVEDFFGLPQGWFIIQTKISDNGDVICALFANQYEYGRHRVYLLSKNSVQFSISGFVEYSGGIGYTGVLATDSNLRQFLVETNFGPNYFIV